MPVASETTDFLDPPEKEGELGRLGPYRVTSLLGLGGMGQVFRAEDTRLKRTIALKVMNKKFAGTQHSRKRFIEEARSMAAVHHDNVATIFEVGQHRKTPYMAMELLQGKTLEQLITEGRHFSFDEILEIGKQSALGLNAAHERGIVHRDIKPANLWMQTPQQRIKILDFGLALAGTGVDELSAVGSVVGTLGYLAPEQASNEPVDERIDLYALGVVMYELCCGKLPLLASNVSSQLITILAQEPVPLRQRNPKVPEPLANLIDVLLQKDPCDRIPTAMKLHERLVDVVDEIKNSQQKQLEINLGSLDSSTVRSQPKSKTKNLTTPQSLPKEANADALDDDDEEEVFELDEPDTPLDIRKWLPVGLLVLVILGLAGYWMRQPKKVAQRVSDQPTRSEEKAEDSSSIGGSRTTGAVANSNAITIESLKSFSIEIDPGQETEVKLGDYVSRKVRISNQSESQQADPRIRFRGESKVAGVAISLRLDGEVLPEAPAYPQWFSSGRLPPSGKSIPVTITFPTKGLKPGAYDLVIKLQTPEEKTVSTKVMPLVLIKSSQKSN